MSEIRVDTFKAEDGISAPSFPNGIQVTGVITSTSLQTSVDFLDIGSNIKAGNSGILTVTELKATNVSVAGTLTYEDVTNVDSVGLVTARDGVFIPDTKELKIGNTAGSPDLKIYHDSSDSWILGNTGSTIVAADTFLIKNKNNSASLARFNNGSDVKLYFNNNQKLATTNTGVTVTGAVIATSYEGDGSNLTGVDPSATASSSGFLKVLNATTPQIRLSNDTSDNDDQHRSFFGIATGNNHFINGSTANDTVLRARADGDLILGIGSTIRMRIDENGQVTKPAQVCFGALNSTGSGDMNSGSEHIFKYSTSGANNFSNVGNVHNGSNGRFTAPVAGNYLVWFGNLVQNQRYSFVKKNGSYLNGSNSWGYSGASGYNQLSAGTIITLAANDYVEFVHTGSGTSYGNQHGCCYFALLS